MKKKAPVYSIARFRKYGWAAAIVLLLSTGTWLFITKNKQNQAATNTASVQQDVLPGKPGAVLTLADGSQVVLDSMGNGLVATQQGADIKLRNGQLAYEAAGDADEKLTYNTLSTPKGREFKVVLPDGTQVWLNSSSSIRYPTRFNNKERLVYISGEAYVEVAPLAPKGGKTKIPFKVKISSPGGDGGTIEVLGTHFNINAYEIESQTTLLEGSVKVSGQSDKVAVTLKPGQQAQVGSKEIKTIKADIDKVMAWRRGFFNFDDASLEEVMRQLTRWYDLEIEYEAGIPAITFKGELSRNMKLSGVLKALEESEVHFRLEGRKIIVLR